MSSNNARLVEDEILRLEQQATAQGSGPTPEPVASPNNQENARAKDPASTPVEAAIATGARDAARFLDIIATGEGGIGLSTLLVQKNRANVNMLYLADSSRTDLDDWDRHRQEILENGDVGPDRVVVVPIGEEGLGSERNCIRGVYNFTVVERTSTDESFNRIASSATQLTLGVFSAAGATGSSGGPEWFRLRRRGQSGHSFAITAFDPIPTDSEDFSLSFNSLVAIVRTNLLCDLWLPVDNMPEFGKSWTQGGNWYGPSPSYRRALLEARAKVANRPAGSWCLNNPEAPVVNDYVARVGRMLVQAHSDPGNMLTLFGNLSYRPESGGEIDIRWAVPHLWPLNTPGMDPAKLVDSNFTSRDAVVAAITSGSLCRDTKAHTAKAAIVLGRMPESFHSRFFNQQEVRSAAADVLGLPEQLVQTRVNITEDDSFELAVLLVGADFGTFRSLRSESARASLKAHFDDRFDRAAYAHSQAVGRATDNRRKNVLEQAWKKVQKEFHDPKPSIAGQVDMDLFQAIDAMGEAAEKTWEWKK